MRACPAKQQPECEGSGAAWNTALPCRAPPSFRRLIRASMLVARRDGAAPKPARGWADVTTSTGPGSKSATSLRPIRGLRVFSHLLPVPQNSSQCPTRVHRPVWHSPPAVSCDAAPISRLLASAPFDVLHRVKPRTSGKSVDTRRCLRFRLHWRGRGPCDASPSRPGQDPRADCQPTSRFRPGGRSRLAWLMQ